MRIPLLWNCPLSHTHAPSPSPAETYPNASEKDIIRNLYRASAEEKCQLKCLSCMHRQESMRKYEQSADALHKYTATQFNNNAHQYKRQSKEMLDAVAFSA